MKPLLYILLISVAVVTAEGARLPGFRVENLAIPSGFASSLAVDSRGTIYYTTTNGDLFRLDGTASTRLAQVATDGQGNSGLLGMALIDDDTAVVHYTTPRQTADIVSRIDLRTGQETILTRLIADITFPERGSSSEHHGGNPTVAPDGSIYFGVGDYGAQLIASLPEWNAGKIFRIDPDGTVSQYARGFRNPFDLAWEPALGRLVVSDNGPIAEDEIHIVTEGDYCGWPFTYGDRPAIEGATPPSYVFRDVIAPTGMVALTGAHPQLPEGILLGAFVSKAIYYFPTLRTATVADPLVLIEKETSFVIDVVQSSSGEIFFTTGSGIHALRPPRRGDCNGDSLVDLQDMTALQEELKDGSGQSILYAHLGGHAGSWGCDVNEDRLIDRADLSAQASLLTDRARAIRRR